MSTCKYERSKKELRYPRVLWVAECGFQYAQMHGYVDNYKSGDHGDEVHPDGNCMKCKKLIIINNKEGK